MQQYSKKENISKETEITIKPTLQKNKEKRERKMKRNVTLSLRASLNV